MGNQTQPRLLKGVERTAMNCPQPYKIFFVMEEKTNGKIKVRNNSIQEKQISRYKRSIVRYSWHKTGKFLRSSVYGFPGTFISRPTQSRCHPLHRMKRLYHPVRDPVGSPAIPPHCVLVNYRRRHGLRGIIKGYKRLDVYRHTDSVMDAIRRNPLAFIEGVTTYSYL